MLDYTVEADGSPRKLRRVVFPVQVPLTAKVSIRYSTDAVLSGIDLRIEREDRSDRIEVDPDRLVVQAFPGEVVHVRWVEPGGDPKNDLSPDPAGQWYHSASLRFRPSPYSRRMSLEVRHGGEIVDVTEPFRIHHWLDDFYAPGPSRPLRMTLDLGIGIPGLVYICALMLDVPWAKETFPYALAALSLFGIPYLVWLSRHDMVVKRIRDDIVFFFRSLGRK